MKLKPNYKGLKLKNIEPKKISTIYVLKLKPERKNKIWREIKKIIDSRYSENAF